MYNNLLDVYEGLVTMLDLFDEMTQKEDDCLLAVTMLKLLEEKIKQMKEKKLQ